MRRINQVICGGLLSSTIFLTGCQHAMQVGSLVGVPQDTVAATSSTKYEPTNEADVKVFLNGEKTPGKYETLGKVSVDQFFFLMQRSEEQKLAMLKKKAASLGGNGIINLSETLTAVTGTVIKS